MSRDKLQDMLLVLILTSPRRARRLLATCPSKGDGGPDKWVSALCRFYSSRTEGQNLTDASLILLMITFSRPVEGTVMWGQVTPWFLHSSTRWRARPTKNGHGFNIIPLDVAPLSLRAFVTIPMYLSEAALASCTSKTELALKMKFHLDFHRVTWPWWQTLTYGSDVCPFVNDSSQFRKYPLVESCLPNLPISGFSKYRVTLGPSVPRVRAVVIILVNVPHNTCVAEAVYKSPGRLPEVNWVSVRSSCKKRDIIPRINGAIQPSRSLMQCKKRIRRTDTTTETKSVFRIVRPGLSVEAVWRGARGRTGASLKRTRFSIGQGPWRANMVDGYLHWTHQNTSEGWWTTHSLLWSRDISSRDALGLALVWCCYQTQKSRTEKRKRGRTQWSAFAQAVRRKVVKLSACEHYLEPQAPYNAVIRLSYGKVVSCRKVKIIIFKRNERSNERRYTNERTMRSMYQGNNYVRVTPFLATGLSGVTMPSPVFSKAST